MAAGVLGPGESNENYWPRAGSKKALQSIYKTITNREGTSRTAHTVWETDEKFDKSL